MSPEIQPKQMIPFFADAYYHEEFPRRLHRNDELGVFSFFYSIHFFRKIATVCRRESRQYLFLP